MAFDGHLSPEGETLPIAKRDVPGDGKFQHAARMQGRQRPRHGLQGEPKMGDVAPAHRKGSTGQGTSPGVLVGRLWEGASVEKRDRNVVAGGFQFSLLKASASAVIAPCLKGRRSALGPASL